MKDTVVLVTAILGLLVGIGNLLWLALGVWGRVVKNDIERKLIWALISDDSKIDARRLQMIISQSPDRLDPKITRYFQSNGIGSRMLEFYRQNALNQKPDAEAKWKLYVEFLNEWVPQVSLPLGVNLSLALELALQFCKDGGPK